MPVTIDGTTGITTPGATVGAITGILKATSGVVAQAVAGTDYLTSTSGGAITLATAQTASGTSVNFTGIPSWAKRITVMFNGVSTNGTSNLQIQLGDLGGVEITGYVAAIADVSSISSLYTTGFPCTFSLTAAALVSGPVTISNVTGNTWVAGILTMRHDPSVLHGSGSKTLSNTLTQLRITTVNGTDTFDAGTINISYE